MLEIWYLMQDRNNSKDKESTHKLQSYMCNTFHILRLCVTVVSL